MDRLTKATLWAASIILISYVVWFFADCALDDACRIVCVKSARGGCHTERSPAQKQPWVVRLAAKGPIRRRIWGLTVSPVPFPG